MAQRRSITTAFAKLLSLRPLTRALIIAQYRRSFGRLPDLEQPRDFNEKIQWLKLNWREKRLTELADKYVVRKTVADLAGPEILNELYGVYDRVEDIDLAGLPAQFVIKATHGSGWNIICRDKNAFDWETARRKLAHWLRRNYFLNGCEWAYRDIRPRLICERYLHDDRGDPPDDIKIFCFNGIPRTISVCKDRFIKLQVVTFDTDWNKLDLSYENYETTKTPVPRPARLDDMLEIARKLSAGLPFVRVDLYQVNDSIVFGELTLYPVNGHNHLLPRRWLEQYGSWIDLPS